MKFLALIYNDEHLYTDATPQDIAATFEAHGKFGQAAGEAGVFLGGEGLQPIATATTVRVRDDERMLTDGPYAETKEQMLGFYVIDVAGQDEAVEICRQLAQANPGGAYELRPVALYLPGSPIGG